MKEFMTILLLAIISTAVLVLIALAVSTLECAGYIAMILIGIGSILYIGTMGIENDKYVLPTVGISAYCWMQSLLIAGLI